MSQPSTFRRGLQVHANGIRQHVLHYAPASPDPGRDAIVLIPGITSPAATWGFVAEHFGRHADTYVVDVRGRGLSQADDSLDYSLDAQADDIVALAAALDLPHFAIVGHSMGARIAVRAARRQPLGLQRLVLVDPPVSGPGRRAYPANLNWYVDSIRQARRGMSPDDMRAYCPTWTEEQLALRAQWLHTCHEDAIVKSFHAFQSDDIHTDLPKIRCPMLLISAERGDVIRDVDVAEWQMLAPHTVHTRVPDAGHMIPWDNLPGFLKAFGSFLGHPLD